MSKGIVVIGATFVDIKGYPEGKYVPAGRNAGTVCEVHGGVSRNVAEDIANVELRPTFVSVVDNSGISTDVINKLNRHKVDTSYIRRTEDGLGTWLAVFSHNGDVVASISKRPDLSEISTILKEQGAVYAEIDGSFGICPPINVAVVDTTGAGDAFFSGVTIGLTYGKTLGEACHIGARLASSVISTTDNVCPRFMPEEFELKVDRF